jgi:hypothetical protein
MGDNTFYKIRADLPKISVILKAPIPNGVSGFGRVAKWFIFIPKIPIWVNFGLT